MKLSQEEVLTIQRFSADYDFEIALLSASCHTCSFFATAQTFSTLLIALKTHKCKLKPKTASAQLALPLQEEKCSA